MLFSLVAIITRSLRLARYQMREKTVSVWFFSLCRGRPCTANQSLFTFSQYNTRKQNENKKETKTKKNSSERENEKSHTEKRVVLISEHLIISTTKTYTTQLFCRKFVHSVSGSPLLSRSLRFIIRHLQFTKTILFDSLLMCFHL